MGEKLKEAVLKLTLKEFLSKDFVDEVLSKKKVDPNSDQGKILFSYSPFRACNALNSELCEKGQVNIPVGSVITNTTAQIFRIPNFGKKGVVWFKTYLTLFDLRLADDQAPKSQGFSHEAQEVMRLLK